MQQEEPTQTPEELFARNMRGLREHLGWSQSELAARMHERGFNWHPATVYSVEKGERKIPLNEAAAIASLMRATVTGMSSPSPSVRVQMEYDLLWEGFKSAVADLLAAADVYEVRQRGLIGWLRRYDSYNGPARDCTKYTAAELVSPEMDRSILKLIGRLVSGRQAAWSAKGDVGPGTAAGAQPHPADG